MIPRQALLVRVARRKELFNPLTRRFVTVARGETLLLPLVNEQHALAIRLQLLDDDHFAVVTIH